MTVYLTSSPCVDGADRPILNPANGFLEHLRSDLPENPRCVFVASDPEDHFGTCEFGSHMFQAFAEAGMPFSQYVVLDGYSAEFAADLIFDSDLIILAGGHVPTQNRFFNDIGLGTLLQDYDGVILGISAGSMNAAGEVYVQPEEPGEGVDPDFERFLPGLGITDVNVLPHYQQVKDYLLDGRRLYEDITFADSMGEQFFVFVDGTYLLVEDGQTTLYGEAYYLHDGNMEQISEPGDIVLIET